MATGHGRFPSSRKFVHDIPYPRRRELCQLLDADRGWETLAGELGFSHDKIMLYRLAYARPQGSPTDELLTEWSHSRPTIYSFYTLLSKMNRAREMFILQDLIPKNQTEPRFQTEYDYVSETDTRFDNREYDLPAPPSLSSRVSGRPEPMYKNEKYTSDTCNASKIDPSNFNSNPPPLPPKGSLQKNLDVYGSSKSISNRSRNTSIGSDSSSDSRGRSQPSSLDSGLEIEKSISSRDIEKGLLSRVPLAQTLSFPYGEIMEGTNYFSSQNELGAGAFGSVYKANMRTTTFAVKRLKSMHYGNNQNEVSQELLTVMEKMILFRHDNIIQLCAYCLDSPIEYGPCLIFQYMPNGSLRDRLGCKSNTKPLTWLQRCTIIMGAARGIQYLHVAMGSDKPPLIHGDIKSANILLDKYFEPKITDFGLAKYAISNSSDSNKKFTHVTLATQTPLFQYNKGGMPPDFERTRQLSIKTDSFSFGVVILEVCTGLKANDTARKSNLQYLYDLVREYDDSLTLRDANVRSWPEEIYKKMFDCGIHCTEEKKKHRPEMPYVLKIMEQINIAAQQFQKVKALPPTPPPVVDEAPIYSSVAQDPDRPTSYDNELYGCFDPITEKPTLSNQPPAPTFEYQLNDQGEKVPYINQSVIDSWQKPESVQSEPDFPVYASNMKKLEEIEKFNGREEDRSPIMDWNRGKSEESQDGYVQATDMMGEIAKIKAENAAAGKGNSIASTTPMERMKSTNSLSKSAMAPITPITPLTPYSIQQMYDSGTPPIPRPRSNTPSSQPSSLEEMEPMPKEHPYVNINSAKQMQAKTQTSVDSDPRKSKKPIPSPRSLSLTSLTSQTLVHSELQDGRKFDNELRNVAGPPSLSTVMTKLNKYVGYNGADMCRSEPRSDDFGIAQNMAGVKNLPPGQVLPLEFIYPGSLPNLGQTYAGPESMVQQEQFAAADAFLQQHLHQRNSCQSLGETVQVPLTDPAYENIPQGIELTAQHMQCMSLQETHTDYAGYQQSDVQSQPPAPCQFKEGSEVTSPHTYVNFDSSCTEIQGILKKKLPLFKQSTFFGIPLPNTSQDSYVDLESNVCVSPHSPDNNNDQTSTCRGHVTSRDSHVTGHMTHREPEESDDNILSSVDKNTIDHEYYNDIERLKIRS